MSDDLNNWLELFENELQEHIESDKYDSQKEFDMLLENFMRWSALPIEFYIKRWKHIISSEDGDIIIYKDILVNVIFKHKNISNETGIKFLEMYIHQCEEQTVDIYSRDIPEDILSKYLSKLSAETFTFLLNHRLKSCPGCSLCWKCSTSSIKLSNSFWLQALPHLSDQHIQKCLMNGGLTFDQVWEYLHQPNNIGHVSLIKRRGIRDLVCGKCSLDQAYEHIKFINSCNMKTKDKYILFFGGASLIDNPNIPTDFFLQPDLVNIQSSPILNSYYKNNLRFDTAFLQKLSSMQKHHRSVEVYSCSGLYEDADGYKQYYLESDYDVRENVIILYTLPGCLTRKEITEEPLPDVKQLNTLTDADDLRDLFEQIISDSNIPLKDIHPYFPKLQILKQLEQPDDEIIPEYDEIFRIIFTNRSDYDMTTYEAWKKYGNIQDYNIWKYLLIHDRKLDSKLLIYDYTKVGIKLDLLWNPNLRSDLVTPISFLPEHKPVLPEFRKNDKIEIFNNYINQLIKYNHLELAQHFHEKRIQKMKEISNNLPFDPDMVEQVMIGYI